jgi:hypothetical protein
MVTEMNSCVGLIDFSSVEVFTDIRNYASYASDIRKFRSDMFTKNLIISNRLQEVLCSIKL